jgi:transcriptional regulator with XRE-family HTH domain
LAFLVKQKRGKKTLRDVEDEIGVSVSTLSRVENGRGEQLRLDTFFALCDWIGAEVSSFIDDESPKLPTQEIVVHGVMIRFNVEVVSVE